MPSRAAADPQTRGPARGYTPGRRPRWGTLLLVGLLHLAALVGLMQVFTPDFTAQVVERASSLVTVTITAPPEPEAPPPPSAEPDAGAAGEQGRQAVARTVVATKAPLPRPTSAPSAASTGNANASGARDEGAGTGASGAGQGPGSGLAGTGAGAGARPLEKIAGEIANARDYPRRGREARKGHDVVIELTVGADGRVSACRVTDPSPDPAADAITCRLASERFVFRPRLDGNGEAVVGIYRWRQRWF